MKKRILTLSFGLIATFALLGCGGGTGVSDGGSTGAQNVAYIAYSSNPLPRRDVLYKTDGTVSGTSMVSNAMVLGTSAYVQEAIDSLDVDGNYIFLTDKRVRTNGDIAQELYKVDKSSGATSSTNLVSNPQLNNNKYATISQFKTANGRYIFSQLTSNNNYFRVDKIDTSTGTATQLSLPNNIVINRPFVGEIYTKLGDNIYFQAIDTSSNTDLVYKLNSANDTFSNISVLSSYYVHDMVALNGKLVIFGHYPGVPNKIAIYDINSNSVANVPNTLSTMLDIIVKVDNKIYFVTTDISTGNKCLFVMDPSLAPTSSITKLETLNNSDGSVKKIFKHNGSIFYVQGPRTSNQLYILYKTNGTPNNATGVAYNMANEYAYIANNKIYFAGFDAAEGRELWQYDGTVSSFVKGINPGNGSSNPQHIIELNGKLIFQATPNGSINKLFSLDSNNNLTQLN